MAIKHREYYVVSTQAARVRVPWFVRDLTEMALTLGPSFSVVIATIPQVPGDLTTRLPAPILPVCSGADAVLCGPFFVPGTAICPQCVEHWLALDHSESVIEARGERLTPAIEQ